MSKILPFPVTYPKYASVCLCRLYAIKKKESNSQKDNEYGLNIHLVLAGLQQKINGR